MGYNANGNVNSKSGHGETWYFNWNGFDKPRWLGRFVSNVIRGKVYLYGADHMRKVNLDFNSVTNSTPSHYYAKTLYVANGEMELDYSNKTTSGTGENWSLDTVRVYIPGPDGRVGAAELDPNATNASQHKYNVYHYDNQGSIQMITQWGSAAFATNVDHNSKPSLYSYEAWGERRDPADWIGAAASQSTYSPGGSNNINPRGFTGHEMMDDIGLIHMNGRIYDPQIGRFLSADPVILNPNNLQDYNRYTYVRNNPLTYTDPEGYFANVLFQFGIGFGLDVATQMLTNYVTSKPVFDIKYGQAAASGILSSAGVGIMKSAGKAIGAYRKYKTFQEAKIVGEIVSDEIKLSTVSTVMKETAKQKVVKEVKETTTAFATTKTFTYLSNEAEEKINETIESKEDVEETASINNNSSKNEYTPHETQQEFKTYIDENRNITVDLGTIHRYSNPKDDEKNQ
jgi:RHS repeat-associated protein